MRCDRCHSHSTCNRIENYVSVVLELYRLHVKKFKFLWGSGKKSHEYEILEAKFSFSNPIIVYSMAGAK